MNQRELLVLMKINSKYEVQKHVPIGSVEYAYLLHKVFKTVGHFTICSVLFQELVKDHCYMAEDYIKELEAWTDNDYYENNVTKIQLPYNAAVGIFMD